VKHTLIPRLMGVICSSKTVREAKFGIASFRNARVYQIIPLSVTNKVQRYTIFFIAVEALHVSGGFSAHHQELKLHTASGICQAVCTV
jgi:hypothetical protein